MKSTIIIILILALLLTSCQSTPERAAVVYGRDLMKKIKEPAVSFEPYNASSSWQEILKMTGSDTKVKINASINVPGVTAFPVYEIYRV